MRGLRHGVGWLAFLLLITVTGGCSTYYVVKNPESGTLYYTRDINHIYGGAVKFMDERTGNMVTLQNSDIKKIDEREYNTGKYSK